MVGELAPALVLYSTAFAAIVQVGGDQRTITYLTLIAGFASTIFWPLTDALQHGVGWGGTYLAFALMNVALCFPIHAVIARLNRSDRPHQSAASNIQLQPTLKRSPHRQSVWSKGIDLVHDDLFGRFLRKVRARGKRECAISFAAGEGSKHLQCLTSPSEHVHDRNKCSRSPLVGFLFGFRARLFNPGVEQQIVNLIQVAVFGLEQAYSSRVEVLPAPEIYLLSLFE